MNTVVARRNRRTLGLILAVSAAPVLLALLLFFVVHPSGRPAYGELIEPQRPVPALSLRDLRGQPVDLRRYDGYWMMVMAAPAACDASCQQLLFDMRQFRLASGEDQYRVARVWLVLDDAPINPGVLQPAAGTMMLRASPAQLRAWLPTAPGAGLEGTLWLVDPLGHLMMRFDAPVQPMPALGVFKKLLYNTAGWKPRHLEPLR